MCTPTSTIQEVIGVVPSLFSFGQTTDIWAFPDIFFSWRMWGKYGFPIIAFLAFFAILLWKRRDYAVVNNIKEEQIYFLRLGEKDNYRLSKRFAYFFVFYSILSRFNVVKTLFGAGYLHDIGVQHNRVSIVELGVGMLTVITLFMGYFSSLFDFQGSLCVVTGTSALLLSSWTFALGLGLVAIYYSFKSRWITYTSILNEKLNEFKSKEEIHNRFAEFDSALRKILDSSTANILASNHKNQTTNLEKSRQIAINCIECALEVSKLYTFSSTDKSFLLHSYAHFVTYNSQHDRFKWISSSKKTDIGREILSSEYDGDETAKRIFDFMTSKNNYELHNSEIGFIFYQKVNSNLRYLDDGLVIIKGPKIEEIITEPEKERFSQLLRLIFRQFFDFVEHNQIS
jgi:hypothetical protein